MVLQLQGNSGRRNLFPTESNRNGGGASGFYGRTNHWQPGETLPTVLPIDELKSYIHELISNMQSNISAELDDLHQSMSSLTDRIQDVETKLATVPTTPSTVATSGSELEASGGKRRRHMSLEIQVDIIMIDTLYKSKCTFCFQSRIRTVYKFLPDEKKLKLDEQ